MLDIAWRNYIQICIVAMSFLTVFTPVFNRAYIITQLYESLCRQTDKDFEWLVVDDGSDDNIDELMAGFKAEGKITITYITQPNGGKHTAINRGVSEAGGQFFMIVDSDDYLTDNAVEWIHQTSELIAEDNRFAGISGIRIRPDGSKIGGGGDFGSIDANALDIRLKYGVSGDLAEVFKTEVLRRYPFPVFEGEKFCPEAMVWNRIAEKYMLRYCHKGIYVCEYLADGLTAKITRMRRNSPQASMTYYSELYHRRIAMVWRFKAAINFWRFALAPYKSKYTMLSSLSLMAWLPGCAMRFLDRNK